MELAETTPAAPTAAPAPDSGAPDASAPAEETRESRRERVIRRLRDGRNGGSSPTVSGDDGADGGATEDAAASDPADLPAEAAAAEVDQDKPKTSDEERDLALRVSKLQRELKHAQADALELKQKAERFDGLSARVQKARSDPYEAVQLMPEIFGFDFGQLADHIVQNEAHFRQQKKYAELPPDVREELALARKDRLERQQREQAQQLEAQHNERFARYQKSADTFLENNKEDFPLAHAIGWASSHIARAAIERGTKDARALAEEFEKNLRGELTEAVSRPGVLQALMRGNSELGPKLSQLLSNEPKKSPATASFRSGANQAARREGPASLSNGVTASDTAGERDARSERKRRIAEAFKAQYGRR